MLSAVGIEPKNGWIAGYPVTPPVITEIEKGVAAAADAGKLGMGKDQALKVVGDLKAKLDLNVSTGAVPKAAAQTVRAGRSIRSSINISIRVGLCITPTGMKPFPRSTGIKSR